MGDQKAEVLRGMLCQRLHAYRILQFALGSDPTDEFLSLCFSEATEGVLATAESVEPEGFAPVRGAWDSCKASHEEDPKGYLEKCASAYTKLFVGPGELKATPWECVYLSGERMLFQESTLAVRDAYRAEGFKAAGYPHVSDDHIAIELDFVARLAQRALEAFDASDAAEYERLLSAQSNFLDEHLMKWALDYASDLESAAEGTLYAAVAKMLAAFLPFDAALVGELKEAGVPLG